MFWTISAILLVLWALGLVSGSTEGHWVHLLLAFSVASATLGLMTLGLRGRGATARAGVRPQPGPRAGR